MKETTLKKEFNERDLKRIRNIIQKKEHEKTVTSVGYNKSKEEHNEGDVWEEKEKKLTIKNGLKINIKKHSKTGIPLLCPKCGASMNHHVDKKMYSIHNMCLKCVVKMEDDLKLEGKYEEYEKNIIKNNALYFANVMSNSVDDMLKYALNTSFVMEDGTFHNWVGNGIDRESYKQMVFDKLNKLKEKASSI